MTKREELIWGAGFFDGEGCISVYFHKPTARTYGHWVVQAQLSGTHEASVRRFHKIVKEGTVHERPSRSPNHKPVFSWVAAALSAEIALRRLYPYLFTKQKQAKLALEMRSIQEARTTRKHSAEDRERLSEIRTAIQAANGNQKGGLSKPTQASRA